MAFQYPSLVPGLDSCPGDSEAYGDFVKGKHTSCAHPAEVVFQPMSVSELFYLEAGEQVPFVGPRPSVVEDAGHLAVRVVIEQAVDFLQYAPSVRRSCQAGRGTGITRVRVVPPLKRT